MATNNRSSSSLGRLNKLRNRRTASAEVVKMAAAITTNEVYDRMAEKSEAVRYIIGSMQPIDAAYTRNTYAEGDRVKNQLENGLGNSGIYCDYEYQGSVTNDTHIRAKSDIDLLTLFTGFVTIEQPQQSGGLPYQGNPTDDLINVRNRSEAILRSRFPQATVDASGSKALAIEGGSLRRKVDVVASNWYNTNAYQQSGMQRDRGIQILDAHRRVRLTNFPFLHNFRIDNKDALTIGGMRKATRFLKSLKYDADDGVSLSSYDIAAITHAMPNNDLIVMRGHELVLAKSCQAYLDKLAANKTLRESIRVPNETRKVFCAAGANLTKLNELRREVNQVMHDAELDLARSFRKLAEARVEY